jgi:hypothetical protein
MSDGPLGPVIPENPSGATDGIYVATSVRFRAASRCTMPYKVDGAQRSHGPLTYFQQRMPRIHFGGQRFEVSFEEHPDECEDGIISFRLTWTTDVASC